MVPAIQSSLAAVAPVSPGSETPRALFVAGGWPGHEPERFRDLMVPLLEADGFDVILSDSLDVYAETSVMRSLHVIVQQWSMGELSEAQGTGLLEAVRGGVGLAGWHGGLCDAFRAHTDFQFMVGAQFVAHPGGPIDFAVHIVDPDHPITAGLADFAMTGTEQYYMHLDPAVRVLATTTFSGESEAGIEGVVMPVAWTKFFGRGRVFSHTIGHSVSDFSVPEIIEMTRRGVRWAAGD